MHEVHLVRAIVDQVEQEARARNAQRVKSLRIRFNPLTSHSADHVRFSFEIVKKEHPLLESAQLELNELEPSLKCATCGFSFRGEHLPEICPRCASLQVNAVNSTDMVLESFETEP